MNLEQPASFGSRHGASPLRIDGEKYRISLNIPGLEQLWLNSASLPKQLALEPRG